MLAILRRVLLAAGLLSAAWLAFHVETPLVRLSIEDVSGAYEKAFARGNPAQMPPYEPLAAFVGDRTKGRSFAAEGPEWRQLLGDLAALGASSRSPLASRRGQTERAVFFRPDEPPVAEIAPRVLDRGIAFVRLLTPQGLRLARLTVVRGGEVAANAPEWLAYPHRRWAAWPVLAGALCYAFLPWRRQRAPDALRYGRLRMVVVPDVLAAVVCVVLFALPIVIAGSSSGSGALLGFSAGGWGLVTLPLWLLAGAVGCAFGFSAWHEGFELVVEPHGVRYFTLLGDRRIAFAAMRRAECVEIKSPPWRRGFVAVFGALGGRMASRPEWGLDITETDGRRTRIASSALPGFARVIDVLEASGVPIEGPDGARLRTARGGG